MTIQHTVYSSPLEALVALIRSLVAYEQRYQMSSADFYARYQRGEMGDTADVVEWAGDYQHYLQLKAELEQKLVSVGCTPLRNILPPFATFSRTCLRHAPSGMRNRSCPGTEGICASGCALPTRRC